MGPVSTNSQENTTKKRAKISRHRSAISKKIVAFEELISLKNIKKSAREAASLLEVSNSTMQFWRSKKKSQEVCAELIDFISTPVGAEFLQRMILSAYHVIHFGCGGIRGLQEFLYLSKLDHFVASSYGALQAFSVRCEEHIVAFGECEEKKLAEKMMQRKITAGLDEMFRGRHPCLVAIEVVSGFILLEKFSEDRKAETWSKELKPRLETLNLKLDQVVSDLCGAIRASTKDLGATHIPELFHAQYEISKATAAPLASQEREFENFVLDAEEKMRKTILKNGMDSEKTKDAIRLCNLRKYGLERKKERRRRVKDAKKELGKIHHPINIATGELQTAEVIRNKFDDQFKIIDESVKEACLSKSCEKRIEKAKRAFDGIVEYLKHFFIIYAAFVSELRLDQEKEEFFNKVVFPLSYLKMIWKRLSKKDKEGLKPLREKLEAELCSSSYSNELKNKWMQKGKECAEIFQRSSSCVEGRNGMLSLYYHRFHRLDPRSLKALTTVHNFHIRRSDGTTAAERLFNNEHENLFESLLTNVRIPSKPKRQYHDQEKRKIGWEKRLVA